MIRQFTLNLAANETREVALSGIYFQIFQMLQSLVLIEILDKSGGVISLIDSPLESMYIRATERYQTLRFSNGPTAQAFKFFYGDGDAGSNRFSGSITGLVGLDAATLAALESIDMNAATLATLTRPLLPGASFKSATALVANTPDAVFSPAANANGAIIHSCYVNDFMPGLIVLIAKAGAAPTSNSDGEVLAQTDIIYGATYSHSMKFTPTRIAAGLDLYFIGTGAGSSSFRSTRYTLL